MGPTALSACRGPAQPRRSPVCWGLQLLSPLWSPESQQAGTLPVRLCQRSTSARCVCVHQCGSAGHKHTNKKNGNPSSARIINVEHFCAQVRELPVRTEQNRVSSSPPEGDIHPGMRLTSSPPCVMSVTMPRRYHLII